MIYDWSFIAEVAAGIRWDDLLNTAPDMAVLTKSYFIVFAEKAKTRGKSEGGPWGESPCAFPRQDWIRKGMNYLKVSRVI